LLLAMTASSSLQIPIAAHSSFPAPFYMIYIIS
jgi:hypothetical protein